MISEAVGKWLDSDTNIPYPVHYGNIPQSTTARPVIVVNPTDKYDHGNTAKQPIPQKLEEFCIRVVGTTFSQLSTPRDLIVAKLELIAKTHTPTTIGAYRAQCIHVRDIETDSVLYSKEINDRRQPGAPEQDFTYCDIHCLASYHKVTP